jgi:hypothetical protein
MRASSARKASVSTSSPLRSAWRMHAIALSPNTPSCARIAFEREAPSSIRRAMSSQYFARSPSGEDLPA